MHRNDCLLAKLISRFFLILSIIEKNLAIPNQHSDGFPEKVLKRPEGKNGKELRHFSFDLRIWGDEKRSVEKEQLMNFVS